MLINNPKTESYTKTQKTNLYLEDAVKEALHAESKKTKNSMSKIVNEVLKSRYKVGE